MSRLFFSVAISKQLNAVPYLRGVHKPCPLLREETVSAMRNILLVNSQFCSCTCLAPRPMTVVFGLGTRLHVRMRTKLENGVHRNRQKPGSAVNSFIDLGGFEAMKTLSGHKLCAVISISFVLK